MRTDGVSPTSPPSPARWECFRARTGSAVFADKTQALVVATLGTSVDEQRIEEIMGHSWKTFMLHYNFPPYSVGEVRPMRGRVAVRSDTVPWPSARSSPSSPRTRASYTIRIVSDVLESNGSSSMASVCGGALALMDAGVPIKSRWRGSRWG
ncbi:MAG: hypothetical protein R3E12_08365 [Candidatus Eisenbacteria bacterium]